MVNKKTIGKVLILIAILVMISSFYIGKMYCIGEACGALNGTLNKPFVYTSLIISFIILIAGIFLLIKGEKR